MNIKSTRYCSSGKYWYELTVLLIRITKYFGISVVAIPMALTLSGCSVSAGGMIVFGDGIYVGASGGSS